jgi:hypothetical protein
MSDCLVQCNVIRLSIFIAIGCSVSNTVFSLSVCSVFRHVLIVAKSAY